MQYRKCVNLKNTISVRNSRVASSANHADAEHDAGRNTATPLPCPQRSKTFVYQAARRSTFVRTLSWRDDDPQVAGKLASPLGPHAEAQAFLPIQPPQTLAA